jgi:hypothetical protein
MRAMSGTIDWGVASLGLQMVGSVLLALDVFAVPVRETIHGIARKGYYTWLWLALAVLVVLSMLRPTGISPVRGLLWPLRVALSQMGFSSLIEVLPVPHASSVRPPAVSVSERILEAFESLPLFGWWVSVSESRLPIFSIATVDRILTAPLVVVGLPLATLYLFGLYLWNRKNENDAPFVPLSEFVHGDDTPVSSELHPFLSEAILSVPIPLCLTGGLYLLAVLPQVAARVLADILLLTLLAVSLFVPVAPLAVGYYLEDDGYVTSGPRFAGFLLLAVGFVTEFCYTLATA